MNRLPLLTCKRAKLSQQENRNEISLHSSRFIWFGDKPDTLDKRVVHFDSHVPSKRISNLSHMSLLYREDNFFYGANGEFKMCRNSTDPLDYEACLNSDEPWYSAWDTRKNGRFMRG